MNTALEKMAHYSRTGEPGAKRIAAFFKEGKGRFGKGARPAAVFPVDLVPVAKKKGGRFPCPLRHEVKWLVHLVHFFAATLRGRLSGLHGFEGVALDAHVGLVFFGFGRLILAFAATSTTAHLASSLGHVLVLVF
jgi:hypothetical protein